MSAEKNTIKIISALFETIREDFIIVKIKESSRKDFSFFRSEERRVGKEC